jgi:hypothetical protein
MKDPSSRRAGRAGQGDADKALQRPQQRTDHPRLREVEGGRESHRGLSLVGDLALDRHILQEIVRNKL